MSLKRINNNVYLNKMMLFFDPVVHSLFLRTHNESISIHSTINYIAYVYFLLV